MARRWLLRVCSAIFVAGVAGIIVATINGNNAGVILSIGLVIALAAIALLAATAVDGTRRIEVFDDAASENLERMITDLAAKGADETAVRALVRETRRLGQQ